jgi:GNAT superfamily N-acetyltransferase
MEGHQFENAPRIELRDIALDDEETLKSIAALITEHSWFEGYPVDPMDEMHAADYVVGAYEGDTLAGFGAINRVASPDEQDNGAWWLADAVVLPKYRKQSVYSRLYEARMKWLEKKSGRILTCTENQVIDDFMLARGWHLNRDTKDEQGNPCRVYEFDRKEKA